MCVFFRKNHACKSYFYTLEITIKIKKLASSHFYNQGTFTQEKR